MGSLRAYAAVLLAMMGSLVLVFALAQLADVSLLVDPRPALAGLGALAAAAAVGLLVADVVLPVPSSAIMIWLGAAYGWLPGAALSLAGTVGATLVAFWVGRRGGPLLARWIHAPDRARADRLLARWGALAIVVTRPVPIIAETVAVLAGTSPLLRWRMLVLAAVVGNVPWAIAYGIAGASIR